MNNRMADYDEAVWILKHQGPLPLSALAKALKITVVGVRLKLLKLSSEGLVEATTIAKGRGRPQQIWALTSLGHAQFSDNHADLTVKLITTMREALGEEAVQAVITANEKKMIHKYQEALRDCSGLENKLGKLAEIRSHDGYMAAYKKEDAGYLLIENHCPICAAAQACQGFCKSELNTFQTVLGENVQIKRIDHILAGARRCAYQISEK
ncbi:helix-turn-helix transcriptional regulator [Chitinophaga nivalis]|uniref:MarR family transcriptional regulator n=1 Tax=Chitinophaga nivalis TaxID=2991709 RepID=A0ABT3ISC4_9BACT|nr:MarR family transcriptional regulator [Chitinophaga nivalis]MCW3463437.1 MarR family transcriptional regulator [Chitinophaga nivalis]MCW3486873.1 MarR family transcriptional regulator [Chitinophaga nivalis]